MIRLDVLVEDPRWEAALPEVAILAQGAADATARVAGGAGEASLLLADDESLRSLNREWRGTDAPTNVLSFPATPPPAGVPAPKLLGDVAVAYETVAREAADEGRPLAHHLAHMIVHGLLHLIGHDHDEDGRAEAMEGLETRILARLGLPDPYRDTEPEA